MPMDLEPMDLELYISSSQHFLLLILLCQS